MTVELIKSRIDNLKYVNKFKGSSDIRNKVELVKEILGFTSMLGVNSVNNNKSFLK